VDDAELAARVHELLQRRGETVATAESLTGGQLAARLTAVPGASRSYLGGVVSYATSVKIEVLGVPADLVERHGVISAPCASAMAERVAALTGAGWGLATTGVAGPDPQEGHPPGTVYVGIAGAVAGPGGPSAVRLHLSGDRAEIQAATCREALALLAGRLAAGSTDGATDPARAVDAPREEPGLG